MKGRSAGPVRGSAPEGHSSSVETWALGRRVFLDNLKVVLIAAIIAIHAVLSYTDSMDLWPYDSVREVTLSPVTETALLMVVGPFGFFVIPLMFLVAGLLAPPSLERRGVGAYARGRLLRLGVPFAVYVMLVQPAVSYALEHPLGEATGSYTEEFLGKPPQLGTGPLWFVGVLLIFSLLYAGAVAVRPRGRARHRVPALGASHLLLLAAVVALASFLVRLAYPIGTERDVSGLQLWEWPGCIAAFTLGITGCRQGWQAAVPERLHRQCRVFVLLAVVALAAFMAGLGALAGIEDVAGGRHWPALVFAALEGVLVVFGAVWLLGLAQRHLDRPLRGIGPAVSRSAYGAFILQELVLIGFAVVLRPFHVPAELKALVLAGGGIVGSFALARLLLARVPGLARIL
ncbi:acyltransferase [Streptomyces sp. HUAS ZL42]|uniref:acyltransferase family protein n=1 Tax=Streptomyces sp. HUAS ZL42 TaxID=3231715 RepID=UPI00345E83F0